ncbi:DJ-1 family glyoxalase III [Caproiciproducens sp. CPB-2]|uniref:DJ-1 family glyoxalase III n=1 Tax=Caproiciproducens sp. CPB-2 TaxID=3030017 RepID=UPI0023DC3F3D|nr:DJ-1 family glyoxalase III [Caproiciproducens sp. CPB-2]MDF1494196.1 DJ-1/PfpI family protein [Caproiciproducens sp. CPB-2]
MIYLFLANGFEEIEALATVDVLRRAGCDVVTVGVGGKKITGSHRIEVTADIEEKEAVTDGLDMVVLPGGMPGTLNLEKSPIVKAVIRYCAENDRYLCAICAAPSILGHMNLLKEHTATCFPGYEQELHAKTVSSGPVCVSGKIVTARGAGVAVEFALQIVEVLFGAEKSKMLRKSMQCM